MPLLYLLRREERVQEGLIINIVHIDEQRRVWLTYPYNGVKTSEDHGTELIGLVKVPLAPDRFLSGVTSLALPPGYVREDDTEHGFDNLESGTVATWPSPGGYTEYRWLVSRPGDDGQLGGQTTPAALIPEPAILDVLKARESELDLIGHDLKQTNFLAIKHFLETLPIPSLAEFPTGAIFIGFGREYMHMTSISTTLQMLRSLEEPINFARDQTAGSSTLEQVIQWLEVPVLDRTAVCGREREMTAGASFEVTVAEARNDSTLPSYVDGKPRRQWKKGDCLALKRPKLQDQDISRLHSFVSVSGIRSSMDSEYREGSWQISREVFNELRICSHPPLRDHPSLVHLFGVTWQDLGQLGTPCPILIQSCADQGDLTKYLGATEAQGKLLWDTRVSLIGQVLDGLAALHSCNIAHGDVKCGNILVELDADSGNPKAKLSDFGYSIIFPPSAVLRTASLRNVELIGATQRYAAPDIYEALKTGDRWISSTMAFGSDIYAFGLTACSILLAGRDPFEAVIEGVAAGHLASIDFHDIPPEDLWMKSKTCSQAGSVLPLVMEGLIVRQRTENSEGVRLWASSWLGKVLARQVKDRFPTIKDVQQGMGTSSYRESRRLAQESFAVEIQDSDTKLDWLETFGNGNDGEFVYFLAQGLIQRIAIVEVSIEHHYIDIAHKNYLLRKQIFDDLVVKADILRRHPTMVQNIGLYDQARASFCAYQVFICYTTGLACSVNFEKAVEYLLLSASHGYSIACIDICVIRDTWPSLVPDLPTSVIACLEAMTSLGPWLGMRPWLTVTSLLRAISPAAHERSQATLRRAGYSELREFRDPGLEEQQVPETSFRGPDVRYLWLAKGTMAFFQRVVSEWPTEAIIHAIKSGDLPADARTYNNETALYMCCRIGAAELTLALLSSFEWARNQATISNTEGYQPLHWLHSFRGDKVKTIGDALIRNKADINAQTIVEENYRPIDLSIIAENQFAVDYLMSRETAPNRSTSFEGDSMTFTSMTIALHKNHSLVFDRYLSKAPVAAKIRLLQRVIAPTLFIRVSDGCLGSLLESIGDLTNDETSTNSVIALLPDAIRFGQGDLIKSLVKSDVLHRRVPVSCKQLDWPLCCAAKQSRLDIFRSLLSIPCQRSLKDAARLLRAILQTNAGPDHKAIVAALISHLDERRMARAAVNYRGIGSCLPNCPQNHKHSFHPTAFYTAINEGAFDAASFVQLYVDIEERVPTTLYHLLDKSRDSVLEKLEFLLGRGPEHHKYLCDPVTGQNVLHVAVQRAENFKSPMEFKYVLETLLEHSAELDVDINALDHRGMAPLHYAAKFNCVAAVRILLEYGATKDISTKDDQSQVTPYDLALEYLLVCFSAAVTSTTQLNSWNPVLYTVHMTRPVPLLQDRQQYASFEGLASFKVLRLLSIEDVGSAVAHTEGTADEPVKSLELPIFGMQPTTKHIVGRLRQGLQEGTTYGELWGRAVVEKDGSVVEVEVNIALLQQMAVDELKHILVTWCVPSTEWLRIHMFDLGCLYRLQMRLPPQDSDTQPAEATEQLSNLGLDDDHGGEENVAADNARGTTGREENQI